MLAVLNRRAIDMHTQGQQDRLRSVDIITMLSPRLAWRLVRGIARGAFDDDYAGSPLAVCWFTNFSCNANCHFCCKAAEIRAGRDSFPPLPLDEAKRLMAKIRTKVSLLYLSGGEPTIHPNIIDILKEAKALDFDSVGISSNLIALDRKIEILEYVDAVAASIHSPQPQVHAQNLKVPVPVAEKVFDNLLMLSQYARQNNIKVLVNCVINPDNLHTVPDMVQFTAEHGLLLELVPANDCGRIPRVLSSNRQYAALIDRVIEMRQSGQAKHLAGSTYYYEAIRDLKPFRCFPYGVPNIMPDGRLCTPCDVAAQYAVNVLDHENIKDAVKASLPFLGDYPCKQGTCFKAGIIERSRLFGLLAAGLDFDSD
jgi:MoaA/NifB/PqqE/SkfB family radical SAM enzyme